MNVSCLYPQDILQYSLVEEAGVTDFFYLEPRTGLISLKQLLENEQASFYEVKFYNYLGKSHGFLSFFVYDQIFHLTNLSRLFDK